MTQPMTISERVKRAWDRYLEEYGKEAMNNCFDVFEIAFKAGLFDMDEQNDPYNQMGAHTLAIGEYHNRTPAHHSLIPLRVRQGIKELEAEITKLKHELGQNVRNT